jgi:hypothetical protein
MQTVNRSLPLEGGICYVCRKEESCWSGYAKDDNGVWMNFCENCKMDWIKFAEKRGAQFASHELAYGVKDGKCAHVNNLSLEKIIELWKLFLRMRPIPFIFR